ncbi:MAG: hypothetical protein M1821_008140 [Bathelium mastoideum]|nr:MAG: hypothetical protein M1821_008140 [Bathelium mastoideum]
MNFSSFFILGGIATFAGSAFGIALPNDRGASTPFASVASVASMQPEWVTGNLTLFFAWLLVGGAPDQATLHSMCTQFPNISGSWAAEGLDTALIKEVIDTNDGSPPNPVAAARQWYLYNTEIFLAQIFNVAPRNSSFLANFCNQMNTQLLIAATLNATRMQTAVCGAAGLPVPPQSPGAGSPETGLDVEAWASSIYGWLAIGISNSTSEIASNCTALSNLDSNLTSSLGQEGLVVPEIQGIFCSITGNPPSPAQAMQQVVNLSTQIFYTIIMNIGQEDGYIAFLCSSLEIPAMNAIGLDGQFILNQICSRSSLPGASRLRRSSHRHI